VVARARGGVEGYRWCGGLEVVEGSPSTKTEGGAWCRVVISGSK
jgi:hypothetical protein